MNKRRGLLVSCAMVLLVFISFGLAEATTTVLKPTYGNDSGFSGWGGSWDCWPDKGWCDIYMNALSIDSEAYAWVGSSITFTSTKSVYMDASLKLKAYMSTAWPWGSGVVRAYLECRYTSDKSLVWTVQVWMDVHYSGDTQSYDNYSISCNTASFPKSTAAGTYYFCARISFVGHYGGLFQWSSSSGDRARLYVSSITVTY